MILTQCAFCAADLGLSLGKKCGRCGTRYCGAACQKQHWEEGGHDKLCKKIKKSGGAEQYHANKNYAEALVVAVEACADDTKGQTCYICGPSIGKRRRASCAGARAAGRRALRTCRAWRSRRRFCVRRSRENNLGGKVLDERWHRWHKCSLCEQGHHGVVACALGWACWKMYVGRPERDNPRLGAMSVLGNSLSAAKHREDALSVQKAELSLLQRLGDRN